MPNPLISPGELIDRSWERYRTQWSSLLSISGWLLAKALIDVIALSFYPTVSTILNGTGLTASEQMGVALFMMSNMVLAPLLGLWIMAVLVRYTHQQIETGTADVRVAMREGTKWLPHLILVSMFILGVLLGGIALGVVPPIAIVLLGTLTRVALVVILGNALVVFGVLAATVINIRWGVLFVLSPYALLTEEKRGKDALVRSRELVRGHFWGVLLRYALPKIAFVALGVIALGILSYITNLAISAAAGLNLDVQLRLQTITGAVYPIAMAAVINPLLVISDILLYRNLSGK